MAIAAQPFAMPLTDEDREWMEAQEYAQTHTPDEMLNDGLKVITRSLASGEITREQADLYMRVLMAHYVGALASEQINGYLDEVWGMRPDPSFLAKFNADHIHKALDYREARSQRQDRQAHAARRTWLIVAVTGILAVLVVLFVLVLTAADSATA